MALPRDGDAGAARRLEQATRHQRVADLVLAAQRERQRAVDGVRRAQRHAGAPASIVDVDVHVLRRLDTSAPRSAATRRTTASASSGSAPATTGMPGLMMPAFSNAIAASVDAEVLLVIEADVVMAPATGVMTFVASNRPPRPTSMTATSTPARRNSSNAIAVVDFEERRRHGQRAARPAADRRSSRTSSATSCSVGGIDRARRRSRTLGQVGEMRRDVARGPDAGGDERRVRHRGHRALAVGAGDVKGGEAALGVAERLAQAGDVLETELDPEVLEREEAVEHTAR